MSSMYRYQIRVANISCNPQLSSNPYAYPHLVELEVVREGRVSIRGLVCTDGRSIGYPIDRHNSLLGMQEVLTYVGDDARAQAWHDAYEAAATRAALGKLKVGATARGGWHAADCISWHCA